MGGLVSRLPTVSSVRDGKLEKVLPREEVVFPGQTVPRGRHFLNDRLAGDQMPTGKPDVAGAVVMVEVDDHDATAGTEHWFGSREVLRSAIEVMIDIAQEQYIGGIWW